jgi:hypothetical protein
MQTKIGSLYFNEIDFPEPPIISGEGEYTHRKDTTKDHVKIKVAGKGLYTMQVGTRRNAAGRLYLTISLYDDQFRLTERKEKLFAELVSAVQKGPEALEELIIPDIRNWLEEDYPEYCNTLVLAVGKAVETLVKASKNRVREERKPANLMAGQQHRIYHSHRIDKTSAA